MWAMSRRLFLALLVCCSLAGCPSQKKLDDVVQVTGRVTDAGTPLHVEGRDVAIGRVTVGFYPLNEDGELIEATSAEVDAEGNFECVDGLKPGTYRIAVRQWDPYDTVDRLGGRFDSRNSKIVREISGEQVEIIIDVSKPEG